MDIHGIVSYTSASAGSSVAPQELTIFFCDKMDMIILEMYYLGMKYEID